VTEWHAFLTWIATDVSIEQVAALSSRNTLPEPTLDLDALHPSTSTLGPASSYNKQDSPMRLPAPAYSSEDPWSTARSAPVPGAGLGLNPGAPSALSGSGLPKDWWKKQENVSVSILGQQGFILNRYTVYEVSSDVRFPRQLLALFFVIRPTLTERYACTEKILRICVLVGLLSAKVSFSPSPCSTSQTDRT
jgi:hypothetical protein